MKKTQIYTLLAAMVLCSFGHVLAVSRTSKVMESFEDGIPSSLKATGGKLSLDTLRMKHGHHALRWDWVGNDALIFNTPIGYHAQRNLATLDPNGPDKYLMNGHSSYDNKVVLEFPRGFFMWIYNEKASTRRLTFQFGRGDKVDCAFDYYLDFEGWRTVSIMYDRGDMRGVPHPDMNRMTILAPATGTGTYYLDALGISLPMNPKTVGHNPQLPYIKPHTRLVTQYEHRLMDYDGYRPSFPLKKMDAQMEQALVKLDEKVEEFILPAYQRKDMQGKSIDGIRKQFAKFEIRRVGNAIYGRPLVKSNIYPEYFVEMGLGKNTNDGCMQWRNNFGKILIDIAKLYRTSQNESDKKELEQMFLDVFDYGVDQGFDVGAGLGWIHHFAYEIREVGPAFFLMRDVLEAHHRLAHATEIMRWFYGFGQVYRDDLVYGVKGRIAADADDTQGLLLPRLYTACIQKNSPEKVRDLKHFSSHFSNVVANYANGLDEIYKPDGIAFHHAGHAQGYGGRGVHGGVATLYLLGNSPFRATPQAQGRMRKIARTLFDCLFTNKYLGPRAFASIRFSTYQLPSQFLYIPALIALGSDTFDAEMAGFYKDLIASKETPNAMDAYWMDKLKAKGAFETYHYAKSRLLSYSCVLTRREDNDWMATVRGHSKYVYPYESWGPDYFAYPTFIAYGYLDVCYPKHLDSTQPKAGTWIDGYDWHRWPGTTSVYIPYPQMRTSPGQVKDEGGEYPFSDQGFVGGVESLDGNGIFVLPFKGHELFQLQTFTGKKSYFVFDNFVVCLGSNIHSEIDNYQVETTILQNKLSQSGDTHQWSLGDMSAFPFEKTLDKGKAIWIIDNRNTGYYIPEIPKGATLQVHKQNQSNPSFDGQGTKQGDFASVVINHGVKPSNAKYNYAVVMNTNQSKMEAFASAMQRKDEPYKVIQQNEKAHVVTSPKLATTAYAIYDASAELKSGVVKSVNRPATFIVKEQEKGIKLTVSDPDLNIYDGQDDLLPNGMRTEVSIYEHEWFYWPSRASKVQITLKGKWSIAKQIKEMETAEHKKAKIISSNKSETVIEFECRDGLSAEVALTK